MFFPPSKPMGFPKSLPATSGVVPFEMDYPCSRKRRSTGPPTDSQVPGSMMMSSPLESRSSATTGKGASRREDDKTPEACGRCADGQGGTVIPGGTPGARGSELPRSGEAAALLRSLHEGVRFRAFTFTSMRASPGSRMRSTRPGSGVRPSPSVTAPPIASRGGGGALTRSPEAPAGHPPLGAVGLFCTANTACRQQALQPKPWRLRVADRRRECKAGRCRVRQIRQAAPTDARDRSAAVSSSPPVSVTRTVSSTWNPPYPDS